MKKFLTTKTPTIIVALLCFLFNLIFLITINYSGAKASLWIGYAFVNVSFIIMICLTLFVKLKSTTVQYDVIPIFSFTFVYFVVSLIANIIIIAVNSENVKAVIIVNAIILVFYAILLIIAFRSFSRVAEVTEKRKEQVSYFGDIRTKVAALVSYAQDEEVSSALQKLETSLKYSSTASTPKTVEYDARLKSFVDQLEAMIMAEDDKEEILKIIKQASVTLDIRNRQLMLP